MPVFALHSVVSDAFCCAAFGKPLCVFVVADVGCSVYYCIWCVCLSVRRLSCPDLSSTELLASGTYGTGESVCCHGDDGKIEFVPAAPSTRPFPGDWYQLH